MEFSHKKHWIEWCSHTNYSFLLGASYPCDYVNRADEYGYSGLGICDFNGVYGLAKAYRAIKKISEKSQSDKVKIFYGSEMHLNPDHDLPISVRNTVIMYALNSKGYQTLCALLTKLHSRGKNTGFISIDDIYSFYLDKPSVFSNLVCFFPMRGALVDSREDVYQYQVEIFKKIFKDRCYQILSPYLHPSTDHWLDKYVHFARSNGLKVILSQDAFFCENKDKVMSDLLQSIRTNSSLDDASDFMFVNDECCLKSIKEIYARYRRYDFFDECIQNSKLLAKSFTFCFSELSYEYPQELVPSGYTSYQWLEKQTYDYANKYYDNNIPEKVMAILLKELSLVKELRFADYFLTVADIVAWARSQGILCQGRGSAANSAICFVLGVTSVDPSTFDVLFERFISAERGDPPDIDVDFEHERREEVISYIYKRYGRHRAAMVANVITFRTRGALRAVGKSLGIPDNILDEAAGYLGRYSNRGTGVREIIGGFVEEFLAKSPEYAKYLKDEVLTDTWIYMTKRLKGYPRHLGLHSGGFMISHLSIDHLSPIEPATKCGRTVIQWDKDDVEALGFFKIDVLALGMLTAIRKTFDVLDFHYNRKMTLATVPKEDRKTYDMISKAETVGVFQIESRAQMSMLPRMKPRTFYDLVIEVAIIRPGPIQGGLVHPFLKRRNGLEPVVYPHTKIKPILKRTLGVPIFQEQVMRIAMAIGGFSAGEADELRRKMGAWQIKGDLSGLLKKLECGMRAEGVKEHFIIQILKQMEAFSAYGFPESHAVSFALLAYVSSYLKCHHPDAFFVSLLNSMPMGFYSAHTILREVKKENIEVRRICVMFSMYDHTLEEKSSKNVSLDEKPFALRLGFRIVRALSQGGAERLVLERKKRQQEGRLWRSMDEFMSGQFLDRGDLVALASSDAFSVFGIDRRQAIWKAHAAPLSSHILERENILNFKKETPKERVDTDFRSFETSLYGHPVDVIKLHYWEYTYSQRELVDSRAIKYERDKKRIKCFGLVIARQAPPTASGMLFITLEDGSGFISLAVRPSIYRQYAEIFDREVFLFVEGVLQKNSGAHSVMVQRVYDRDINALKVYEIDKNLNNERENNEESTRVAIENAEKNGEKAKKTYSNYKQHPRDIPRFAIRNFH